MAQWMGHIMSYAEKTEKNLGIRNSGGPAASGIARHAASASAHGPDSRPVIRGAASKLLAGGARIRGFDEDDPARRGLHEGPAPAADRLQSRAARLRLHASGGAVSAHYGERGGTGGPLGRSESRRAVPVGRPSRSRCIRLFRSWFPVSATKPMFPSTNSPRRFLFIMREFLTVRSRSSKPWRRP